MSLKKGSEPQNVNQLINNFENRLNNVKKELPNLNNRAKRETVKKHFKDLGNLQVQIPPLIANASPEQQDKYDRLCGELQDIKDDAERQIDMYEKQEAQQQQMQRQGGAQGDAALQASLLQETNEVENLNRETQNIVEDMKAIDDAATLLKEKIDEQHEIVVRVDNTIEDAHEEMVEGNNSLNVAQEHQKHSTKCLLFILLGVVAGIVVLGLIIGLSLRKKKN